MSSLLKEIEELNAPIESLPDLEDVDFFEALERMDEFEEKSKKKKNKEREEEEVSNIKRRVAMEIDDEKYKGVAVSRKEMFGDFMEMGQIRRKAEEEDDDVNIVEDSDKSEDEVDVVEETDEDEMEQEVKQDKVNMSEILKPISQDDQTKKSESVRKQLAITEQILLLSIKAHSAQRNFNELPRGKTLNQCLSMANDKTKMDYNKARENAYEFMSLLLEAREVLLSGSSQTKNIGIGGSDDIVPDSEDEEIESDEEKKEEEDNDSVDVVEETDLSDEEEFDKEEKTYKQKKKSLKNIEKEIIKNDSEFDSFRKGTLSKWDERTKLVKVGGKKKDFSAFQSDIITQIDKILVDKKRLVGKSQIKRAEGDRIGGDKEATFDVEIFDDDDFYQTLLKDFIEGKSSSNNGMDSIQMSRQWLDLERLRQKRGKKKKVDTKASKGRKIRYTVLTKLVNFHAGVPECVVWSHEARNELFKSLFT